MTNDYNNKRINPPLWQHDYHVLNRLYGILFDFIKKYLKEKSNVIIDYGCGTSPYKELFLPFAKRYTGVDLSDNKDANIKVGEEKPLPLKDGTVDIVLSTQVLEHVDNVDFYLSESRRLLKNNGILILSTHGIWPYHPYPADYHRWTRKGLEKTLGNAGFKCLKISSILGPFASVTQFTLVLIAERLRYKGILAKLLRFIFFLVGNCIIWLEDLLFPVTEESDASIYVVCAKKI